MGREVEAQVQYQGRAGLVRALLESDALILRGEVRARIARGALLAWRAEADDLCISTADGPLTLTMGQAEALKWIKALDKPLPTLAEKLGLANQRLWLMKPITDDALAFALIAAPLAEAASATLGIAVLASPQDLDHLLGVCHLHPALPVWAINEKGPAAGLPESVIRTALRSAGMVDTKACAVSRRLSATRYQQRRG